MGTLITQTPPSSPYDYSPHVLANSPRRIYRDILVLLARLFHPPPPKITWGLTFQLNPLSVTELNLSWEETWLCFPYLFCAIKRVILVQVCIKGIKSLLICQVGRGGGERKLWEKFWKGAVEGIICQQYISSYFECWQLVSASVRLSFFCLWWAV